MRIKIEKGFLRLAIVIFLGYVFIFSPICMADEVGNPEELFKKKPSQKETVSVPASSPSFQNNKDHDVPGKTEDPSSKGAKTDRLDPLGGKQQETSSSATESDSASQKTTTGKNKLEQFLTNLGEKIDNKSKPLGEKIEGKFAQTIQPLPKTVVYSGYGKDFLTIKKVMYEGRSEDVAIEYAKQDSQVSQGCANVSEVNQKLGYLGLLERGTLAIDRGDTANAVERFTAAEAILSDRQKTTKLSEWFTKTSEVFDQIFSGDQEKGTYWGEGYERVLMLNYKTIAFLLAGNRGSYNVTRRAIDWQQMEKEAFEERVNKVQQGHLDTSKQDQSKEDVNFSEFLAGQYGETEAKVKILPNAYVNPFGYYMAGLIQEFEGYNDSSLRQNARIAYEKALELNPDSRVIQKAVEDMANAKPPMNKRLVHVVVGEGFSPEKKVMLSGYTIGSRSVPLKLPYFERVSSKVHRIEVQTQSGRVIDELSTIADVEAICLRHQLDMLPIYNHQISLAFLKDAPKAFFGRKSSTNDEGKVEDTKKTRELDTRAWMSLPAAIQAGRFFLEKDQSRIKLAAFDVKGKKLAETMVELKGDTHAFVYARSIDYVLDAHPSEPLWIASKPN